MHVDMEPAEADRRLEKIPPEMDPAIRKTFEKAKSDLNDQAILQCRMNGGLLVKADVGACRMTESSRARYKVLRSVEFACRMD